MPQITLAPGGDHITLATDSGTHRFHAIWLRDNAPDAATRDPGNGQKRITLSDIHKDTCISHASLEGTKAQITFEPENKTVSYDTGWLTRHAYDRAPKQVSGWLDTAIKAWDASNGMIKRSTLATLQSDPAALRDWLAALRGHGFAITTDGPTESGAFEQVVALFGHVRETNYGRWFEVRTEVNPVNLAYTGLGLQGHTDNPYRDPTPTLQLLYCLENSVDGGLSILTDGFAIAQRLRDEDPQGFELLTKYCARFEYAGDAKTRLRTRHPMIELAPDGELRAIRFNNRSCAPITDVPFDDMQAYYAAYRRFGELVDAPDMQITFKLAPGECVVFDNTRLLHARTGFSSNGARWLQGCYADHDGARSTLAALSEALAEAAQ